MSLHKEIRIEDEICEHHSVNGWRYKDVADYDRQLTLFPAAQPLKQSYRNLANQ